MRDSGCSCKPHENSRPESLIGRLPSDATGTKRGFLFLCLSHEARSSHTIISFVLGNHRSIHFVRHDRLVGPERHTTLASEARRGRGTPFLVCHAAGFEIPIQNRRKRVCPSLRYLAVPGNCLERRGNRIGTLVYRAPQSGFEPESAGSHRGCARRRSDLVTYRDDRALVIRHDESLLRVEGALVEAGHLNAYSSSPLCSVLQRWSIGSLMIWKISLAR